MVHLILTPRSSHNHYRIRSLCNLGKLNSSPCYPGKMAGSRYTSLCLYQLARGRPAQTLLRARVSPIGRRQFWQFHLVQRWQQCQSVAFLELAGIRWCFIVLTCYPPKQIQASRRSFLSLEATECTRGQPCNVRRKYRAKDYLHTHLRMSGWLSSSRK